MACVADAAAAQKVVMEIDPVESLAAAAAAPSLSDVSVERISFFLCIVLYSDTHTHTHSLTHSLTHTHILKVTHTLTL